MKESKYTDFEPSWQSGKVKLSDFPPDLEDSLNFEKKRSKQIKKQKKKRVSAKPGLISRMWDFLQHE